MSGQRSSEQSDAAHLMTSAIYDAMMWNLRAYGKLACEEDAEFFAACALKELRDAGFRVRREPLEARS